MMEEGLLGRFLRATEIDTRMLGMLAALFLIWAGFDLYGFFFKPGDGLLGGQFLTPRNLWTLLVQTSSIAVMATGMVLVIVMRQIDLSVGSVLTTIAVAIGALQVYKLGPLLGVGHPSIWSSPSSRASSSVRSSVRSTARSRPMRRSPPSSSRWAASLPIAASPSCSPQASPWRRWTTPMC